ncbi:MAG: Gfo/Idh/MocA family oxidoreductase [Planctomycetes bacterium]|nr:Gfo/Idh/MocA family oxidoreductase [Planctomycetota bacterium]
MQQHTGINRRDFVKGSSAGLAGIAVGVWTETAQSESKSPNDKLNIGCIGVGGKGWVDMTSVGSENIVAVCDVDSARLNKAGVKFPKAAKFSDFRRLLERKDIDAVTVSTPDHTHAVASMGAMKLGKHVYCQKPLAHSIYEVRQMIETARQQKVATQMGNQGHSEAGTRRMVEWIQAGGLGPVREVHVWTDRPIWPQGIDRPKGKLPIPSTLDWDLWLGPAPERPYHAVYHPFKWRGFWDFGTGALGDMACHNTDTAYWALKLADPIAVEAKSSAINLETAPKWSTIRYEFPQRGSLPPVNLTWYDGGKKPPAELAPGVKLGTNGSIFVGDNATLFVPHYWGEGKIVKGEAAPRPKQSIPDSPGHYQEWINACKGGPPALSNFDNAGPLTEMVLLGNIALRTGKRCKWDPKTLSVPGVPEADMLIRNEYRKGWVL